MRVLFAALIAAFSSPLVVVSADYPQSADQLDQFDAALTVVLRTGETPELAMHCATAAGVPLEGAWQPSTEQITKLRAGLSHFLVETRSQYDAPADRLRPRDFYLQLCPILGRGHRMIFVSAFHKALLGKTPCDQRPRRICLWQHELIGTNHSGDRQFWVSYDTDEDRFYNFTFDGSS